VLPRHVRSCALHHQKLILQIVIDCLNQVEAPIELMSHPVLGLSLLRTWDHGISRPEFLETSVLTRVSLKYDDLCTPR
jgi:hypothetical protein